jgi:P-type Cu2+ transporter
VNTITLERPVEAPIAAPAPPQPCADSRLSVPGMMCAGCISKIEHGLAAQPGIISARVDFGAKQVRIAHLPEVELPQLVTMLDRLGFAAHPLAEAPPPDAEQKRLVSALAIAGFAWMNVMLLSVSVWSGAAGASKDMFHWLSALIAVPAIVWAGRPFFVSAWRALRRGRTNMDVPISIGVTLATAMSLYETATSGQHAWFDGAIMLLFFLLAGRVLDGAMRARARAGASALMEASAPGASIVAADGTTRWVRADAIAAGATMLVAAGERVAADGHIVAGQSAVDASILTGESAPVSLAVGDQLLAGMLNLGAPLTVAVTATGEDRTIAGLARAMEDAGQHRSRYVRIADRASRLYAPAVHTLSALTFAGWLLAGASVYESLQIAVAVLIITCPCALGLAVPVAQVVASGALMRSGILVKDGSALERMAEADRVLLDKTGTVTLGRPQPVDLGKLSPEDRPAALALAQASTHPLSRSLARALAGEGVVPARLSQIAETPGEGMNGLDGTTPVRLGRPQGATHGDGSHVAFARGDGAEQVIAFADRLRPEAAAAVAGLGQLGLGSTLVSGDRLAAVTPVAHMLGITAIAEARPADKQALVERLGEGGARVLMAGDGLNDGPALAAAHVSIAPSSASDVGQQAADMVFTGDSLMAIPRAVRAARATQAVVRQNFALAIGYNVLAVPLAMAGLVTPLIAALAMSLSSLVVVANSLRLAGVAK